MKGIIRILHIVTTMDTGGVETLLMNLYRNIDRTKVQFDFLKHRSSHDFYDDEIIKMGGRIYPGIPFDPRKMGAYNDFLESFFRSHPEYKVVHAHTHYNMFALRAAKKCGVPVRIAHAHTAYPKFDRKYPFKLYNKLNVGRYTTAKIACAETAAEWFFGKSAFMKGEVTVLKNAIDVGRYKYSEELRIKKRAELGLTNELTIIHTGAFREQKNHTFLIDIFAEVLKKEANAVLLLIGDGDRLRQEAEEKAKRVGIYANIRFMGVRGDVNELLQAGDIFVFPSIYEGMPLAAVEAQAAGLICFASETAVPMDARVSDKLNILSLKEPASYWAERILEAAKNVAARCDISQQIKEKGFDISWAANMLCDLYADQVEKHGK